MSSPGWMLFAATICGPACAAVGSAISLTLHGHMGRLLIGFTAGLLLATSLGHLLPDALEQIDALHAGLALAGSLAILALIERLSLGSHHHRSDRASMAGPVILLGDSLHKFTDGLLMAAAFLHSPTLGWAMTAAVFAHELPREAGDFVVLLTCGYTRQRALQLNLLASLSAVIGAGIGWLALSQATAAIPYALCISAASFLYVALTRLVPLLMHNSDECKPGLPYVLVIVGAGFSLLTSAFGNL